LCSREIHRQGGKIADWGGFFHILLILVVHPFAQQKNSAVCNRKRDALVMRACREGGSKNLTSQM
jgi:hypothetical protein